MKKRRALVVVALLLAAAMAAAAVVYLRGRREVTTSSEEAYRVYQDAVANERRFYFKQAREEFARALRLDPQFAEAMLGLARQSDRDQALSLIRRAAKEKSRLTERERLHVDMQLAGLEGRHEDWLKIARAIHDKYPDDIRAAMALCSHEIQSGHTERALQIFAELLAVEPNNAEAYNQIGYYYAFRGDYDKAIENLKKYRFMAPDQANPYDSLGEIQAYSGHYDEAIQNLERALKLKPDFFDSYGHLGVAYEGKGDYPKAIESYEKAANESLTDGRRRDFLRRALRVAVISGDVSAARDVVAKIAALPKDPKDKYNEVRGEVMRAVLDVAEGRPAETQSILMEVRPKLEAAFRKQAQETPLKFYDPAWNYLMARALIAQGKGEEAIPYCEELANPPNPWGDFEGRRWVYEGRALLAELVARKGDLDRAEKLLAENRKWNPSWAPTRSSELAVAQLRREKVLAATK